MARDPKQAEKSRKSIMEAAIKEFARVGYHKTKISDIVTKANFSQRTFYIYFDNKEEIYKELLEAWKTKVIEGLAIDQNTSNYQMTIRDKWKKILEIMNENPDLTKAVYLLDPFIEEIRSDLLDALQQILLWEQQNGFIRDDFCLEILAENILSTMESLAIRYLLPGKIEIDFLASQLADLYINGVKY